MKKINTKLGFAKMYWDLFDPCDEEKPSLMGAVLLSYLISTWGVSRNKKVVNGEEYHNYSNSFIQERLDIKDAGTIKKYMQELELKGYIKTLPDSKYNGKNARFICLTCSLEGQTDTQNGNQNGNQYGYQTDDQYEKSILNNINIIKDKEIKNKAVVDDSSESGKDYFSSTPTEIDFSDEKSTPSQDIAPTEPPKEGSVEEYINDLSYCEETRQALKNYYKFNKASLKTVKKQISEVDEKFSLTIHNMAKDEFITWCARYSLQQNWKGLFPVSEEKIMAFQIQYQRKDKAQTPIVYHEFEEQPQVKVETKPVAPRSEYSVENFSSTVCTKFNEFCKSRFKGSSREQAEVSFDIVAQHFNKDEEKILQAIEYSKSHSNWSIITWEGLSVTGMMDKVLSHKN